MGGKCKHGWYHDGDDGPCPGCNQDKGAAAERAAIVAMLRDLKKRQCDSRHFGARWSPATGYAIDEIIAAIERGDHYAHRDDEKEGENT